MSAPTKIVSGGQTGADRTVLDFAIAHAIPLGGWCPLGRKAEDGPIPGQYQVVDGMKSPVAVTGIGKNQAGTSK